MGDRKERVSLKEKYNKRLEDAFSRNGMKMNGERARSSLKAVKGIHDRFFEHVRANAIECGTDRMNDEIAKASASCKMLVAGETHTLARHRYILGDMMKRFKGRFSCLAMEHIPFEMQDELERFNDADVARIRLYLKTAWGKYGERNVDSIVYLIRKAKESGLNVIGIDSEDIKNESTATREKFMFSVVRHHLATQKIILLCGGHHALNAREKFEGSKIIDFVGEGESRHTEIPIIRAIYRAGLGSKDFILEKGDLAEKGVPDVLIHFAKEKMGED